MHGPNRFKLGIFSANADGGLTLTRVPERWPARWHEVVEVAQMADRAGIEFFLPIARWKGFGGEMNSREWSFETLTHAAALAGVTQRIALFATVHVPMVHPVFAAKALTTVDHASGGRAGLNIVCGWSPQEFDLFGLTMIEDRYAQGLEWVGDRGTHLRRRPAVRLRWQILSAAQRVRPAGAGATATAGDAECRVLAGRTRLRGEDRGFPVHHLRRYRRRAAAHRRHAVARACGRARGRRVHHLPRRVPCRRRPRPRTITSIMRCAWKTPPAWIFYMGAKEKFSSSHDPEAYRLHRKRFVGGAGTYPLIGTPQTIAEEMVRMSDAGFAGTTVSFVNFKDELPYFIETVLPLLHEAGLRQT